MHVIVQQQANEISKIHRSHVTRHIQINFFQVAHVKYANNLCLRMEFIVCGMQQQFLGQHKVLQRCC